MPTVDDRLARLLEGAAVEPASTDVLGAVAAKRRRRAAVRRARAVGAVVAVALLMVGTVTVATRAVDSDPAAIAPRPETGGFRVRVVDAPVSLDGASGATTDARAVPVTVEDTYLRGPVLPSGEFVAVAAYGREGDTFTFPPSRVLRTDEAGRVLDDVELQGEVRSLADGEGARWVLTRDAVVIGPADPEYRVKRVGPDGGVTSTAVPPGEQPNGDIVAAGGGVWVPVRDGVLRFDPATGADAGKIALPEAERRAVVSMGKGVAATTTGALVRLDPARMTAIETGTAPAADVEVIGAALGRHGTWALVATAEGPVLVLVDGTGAVDLTTRTRLPRGFAADGVQAAGGRLWVTGRAGGQRAVVQVREAPTGRSAEVTAAVVLDAARDVATTVTDERTLVFAADGALWRLELGG